MNDTANVIAKPLAYIINLSLRSGQIPKDWKVAQVLPLHKRGSAEDQNNYQPISIHPVVWKILEKSSTGKLLRRKQLSVKKINLVTAVNDPQN